MNQRMRSREIREGIVVGLVVAAILSAWSILRTIVAGLPLNSIVTWIESVLIQPVTMPLGFLLLAVVFMAPTMLRVMGRRAEDEADSLRLIPPTETAVRELPALSTDETNIMLAFAASGRVDMFPEELNAGLHLSDIRMSHALDGLLNRDFIKYQPSNYVKQRPASASLTPAGRHWLLDNGHA
jgi:hypothetical protein